MLFDVIVAGAGPAGSSAATFLSRQGLKTLILDKAVFPRDKVCGDCLAPQALYWLNELGCVDDVLNYADSYIKSGDVFLDGKYMFTGDFPQDTIYPGFCTLLERTTLDHIMVKNAVKSGAIFKPGSLVKEIVIKNDCVEVNAVSDGINIVFKGKILIGADGANSVVSRSLGNVLREGTTAVSVRAYYEDVDIELSKIRIYLDERFFPGMGWVFADNKGKANIGIGYINDKRFSSNESLKKTFNDFINKDLKKYLKKSKQVSPVAGWWASFFRPKTLVADRVLLIGDAANLADPVNGAGIHKAMESAYVASQAIAQSVAANDFSAKVLKRYELLWNEMGGLDMQVRQLTISLAKNSNLREIYILLIKNIARVAKGNPVFQDLCSGVFSGVMPINESFFSDALLKAVSSDPSILAVLAGSVSLFTGSNKDGVLPLNDLILAGVSILKTISRFSSNPADNLSWGLEVFNNAIGTASNIFQVPMSAAGKVMV